MKFILILVIIYLLMDVNSYCETVCYGSTGNGRVKSPVRLPLYGKNFGPYSSLGYYMGRTWVYDRVQRAIVDAYSTLLSHRKNTFFLYGEIGLETGGELWPHKTHQNGLSVDFMVPVLKNGKPTKLPCNLLNKFGYEIDFDESGKYEDLVVDFEAVSDHLFYLFHASRANGVPMQRVIIDPRFQSRLFDTKNGSFLKANIEFNKHRSWVRHDDHYHVDFYSKCLPLSEFK
jgi:penicillin-insensitive murein endopeptidase